MTSGLADEFHRALENHVYADIKSHNFPMFLLQAMRRHGGVFAAKQLLGISPVRSGLIELCEQGRLDTSVESLMLQARWKPLFSADELKLARRRLNDLGYEPDRS